MKVNTAHLSPAAISNSVQPGGAQKPAQPKNGDFASALSQAEASNDLRFSNHAKQRMESRNINLSSQDLSSLNQAVERAEEKGSRDSLVILRETAFVVNVPNRTVITAVRGNDSREGVFTNIDSTVFAWPSGKNSF